MTYEFSRNGRHYHGHFSPKHYRGHGHSGGGGCGGAECACFASGSRILTARGEIAVEFLRSSDRLITHDGRELPIKWIGWRRVNIAAHPEPGKVAPIRIAQGALGENAPQRDLLVSPDHAMYLNGSFIPASALVNGANITQMQTSDVAYYHVELDEHAIILAEGAATESFLEREDNRSYFSNSRDATTLHPELRTGAVCERCNKRGLYGRVREWTLARAAGAGHRLHGLAAKLGFREMARAAAALNAKAMQSLLGTAAPFASFGPTVEDAQRQIAERAAPAKTPETSAQTKVAA
jgi:hypothetical protein